MNFFSFEKSIGRPLFVGVDVITKENVLVIYALSFGVYNWKEIKGAAKYL